MKRLLAVALVLVFAFGLLPTAAFAEPSQVASSALEVGIDDGVYVRVTVDLADDWSVQFLPRAFYLYDQPALDDETEEIAFGTVVDEESYSSLLEGHEGDKSEKKGDATIFYGEFGPIMVGPVEKGLYLLLNFSDSVEDPEAVWARVISCEKEDYGAPTPPPVVSGVIEESIDGALVNVTLDLSYGWTAKYYPGAFYLFSPENEDEPSTSSYGTLLNKDSYASLVEAHAEDECIEKDGYTVYKTEEGETSFVAPVDEDLYIMFTCGPEDEVFAEWIWERVSFEKEDDGFEEPKPAATGIVEEAMDGATARVKLDLAYGWAAAFYPMAFYLYSPDCEEGEFDAYGTLLNKESYDSLLESHAEDEKTENGDTVSFKTEQGETIFLAPVDKDLYIELLVSPDAFIAESLWERVAFEKESDAEEDAAQTALGVVTEGVDGEMVTVELDLAYGWSAKFYPMAFYLCGPECKDDGDAYGTLLNEQSYASLLEAHKDDEKTEDGDVIIFKNAEGETTYVAAVGEGLYIMLLVDPDVFVPSAVWERVSYELFGEE